MHGDPDSPRCPVCQSSARGVSTRAAEVSTPAAEAGDREHEGGPWQECASCGALLRPDVDAGEAVLPLARDGVLPPALPEEADRHFLDAYTARIALTARGLWARAEAPIRGHGLHRPALRLWPLRPAAIEPTVALVVLSRRGDPALAPLVERFGAFFDETVVMVDAAEAAPVRGARVIARPLAGDFGAQRNAAQAALESDWALHLDTDEVPEPALLETMRPLCRLAGEDGIRAIGLRRRNMVDGRMSGLFPDTQYRLLQRDGRFENRVHERPLACRDWTRTTITLKGGLVHHLTAERVERRHETYERMGQSAERLADREALRTPFAA